MPSLFKKEFYRDSILLREEQAENTNLVKCDFKIMNVKGLINLDFLEDLYENQGNDDIFFQIPVIQNFIKFAWAQEVQ